MVDLDAHGRYADYDPVTHMATHYQVVFLDPHAMTIQRLPANRLRRYTSGQLVEDVAHVRTGIRTGIAYTSMSRLSHFS